MRLLLSLATLACVAANTNLSAQHAVRVGDTGASVRTWTEGHELRSAVTRDGGATWTPLHAPVQRINWRHRSFDPRRGDPGVAPAFRSTPTNELFLVQFVTDVIGEYGEALRALGADVTRYVPHEAYVVRIPRARIEAVRAQPWVRAVMELQAGHKLDEAVQRDYLDAVLGAKRYNVMLVDKRADAAELEARIVELGGVLEAPARGGVLVEATLEPEQLLAVARENTVLWIDYWSAPEYDMDNLRIQAGVDYVEAVAGIDGRGIRGHVNEGVHDHVEFAARPPYRTGPISLMGSTPSAHGTNTAGEIYAQGLPEGVKGVLPFAQLIYSPSVQAGRYALVQALQDPNDVYKAVMMTQSWGGSRTTQYTSTSALLDDILFDFDRIFATNAHSNSGFATARPEAWAKNVASVGGFLHRNNADPSDDCWCNTASTGPALDGRVGISFTGYYDATRTTSLTNGYTNGFGGSSGATPMVNGLAGGVIQMLTDGLLGYPAVPWEDRFAARPNLTTTRVLLTVSSRQLSFTGANSAQRLEQGWGLPNLQDLYDNRSNILVLDEEDVLRDGRKRHYWVFVKPGTPELRASMHYLEDEAVPFGNPTRINSLDLVVKAPGGVLYRGNGNGILEGPWSTPGGEPNDLDIHENVFLPEPTPGVYKVTVEATAVRADSHKETAAVDADFALAIRGASVRDLTGMVVDAVSNAPDHLDVSLSNVPAVAWTHGFTVMSFAVGRHVSLGNAFGVELDSFARSILKQTPATGNVFAFSSSTDPAEYPNSTYSFPPSTASLVSGFTLDVVAVLLNGPGNVVAVSNVDRVSVP